MPNLVIVAGDRCEPIVEALLDDGCDVVSVPDALALRTAITRATPDLVVLHLGDAQRNLELLGVLAGWFAGIPVPVMMKLPAGDELTARKALQCGVSDFIRECDSPLDLVPRVRHLCRQRLLASLIISQKHLLERRNEELIHVTGELESTREQLARQGPTVLYSMTAPPGSDTFRCAEDFDAAPLRFLDDTMYEAFGYRPESLTLTGRTWLELVHPKDRRRLAGWAQTLLTEGRHVREYRFLLADGCYRWVEDRATVRVDAMGEAVEVIGCLRDETEHHATKELLRRTHGLVRDAQRVSGAQQLAGSVAHDLNNLLSVIAGHGQLAQRALPHSHAARRHLSQILQASSRARDATGLLVKFARSDGVLAATINVNSVVRTTASLMRPLMGASVRLATRLRSGLSAVRIDRTQLERVLLNLCINARDAMPRGGELLIRTGPAPAGVAIEVSDTGDGMDDHVLARCFEPFFTTKPEGKGTGLGLYNVLQTAQAWGGFVTVETEPGRGTTVRIVLPAAGRRAHARKPARRLHRAPAPETSETRINAAPESGPLPVSAQSPAGEEPDPNSNVA